MPWAARFDNAVPAVWRDTPADERNLGKRKHRAQLTYRIQQHNISELILGSLRRGATSA